MTARRILLRVMPLLLTVLACAPRAVGAQGACQLTNVGSSAITLDVPTSLAAIGSQVLAVGTRFNGTSWYPIAAFSSGQWAPAVITSFTGKVIELDDVSAFGAQAWAVGSFGGKQPVAGRWDGSAWRETPITDPGPGEDWLTGVDAVGPNLVWAVGRRQVGMGYATLIERWHGTAWEAVPSPNEGAASNTLKSVDASAPSDVWSVGWSLGGQRYRPLVEHWDGSAWRLVPTPDTGPGDAFLSGVDAVAVDDAWAVGWSTTTGGPRPLVEHWDGRSWSLVDPPADAANAALIAVAASPGGLVAVGRAVTPTQQRPLALVRSGDSWSILSTGVEDTGQFTGVAVDASGTIWAVGSEFVGNTIANSLVMTGCRGP